MNKTERLKQIRKYYKLNQKEFADAIKMAKISIAKWETDEGKLTAKSATLICEKFNINYDWLMYGTGEMLLNKDNQFIKAFKKFQPDITDLEIEFLLTWFALPLEKRENTLSLLKSMFNNLKENNGKY